MTLYILQSDSIHISLSETSYLKKSLRKVEQISLSLYYKRKTEAHKSSIKELWKI